MKRNHFFILLIGLFLCLCAGNMVYIKTLKVKEQTISAIAGYTIFIDPGHGGKDNGTSFNDVLEDEINLNIATKLFESLIDLGAKALIARTGDYDLSDVYAKNHKVQDLNKRIQYMHENKVDLFVSIHLNSYPNEAVSGAQVFFKNHLKESEEFAISMQNDLNQLNKKDKKPKMGDYYILNNSKKINGIIVECGFLSNTQERNKLTTETYQNKIANLIQQGMIEYLSTKNRI